jgi:hypothetical protein
MGVVSGIGCVAINPRALTSLTCAGGRDFGSWLDLHHAVAPLTLLQGNPSL